MTNNQKIIQAFQESLGIKPEAITDELKYNSIPQWDSVAHMVLITAIENAFEVMLDTNDIIDMGSVGKAKEILAKYKIRFD